MPYFNLKELRISLWLEGCYDHLLASTVLWRSGAAESRQGAADTAFGMKAWPLSLIHFVLFEFYKLFKLNICVSFYITTMYYTVTNK